MEGGVALFLLFIILVVAAIAGIALYLTGGALTLKEDRDDADADEPPDAPEAPTSPTQEKVIFAGTEQDHERKDSGRE